jgi:hypothetical protein
MKWWCRLRIYGPMSDENSFDQMQVILRRMGVAIRSVELRTDRGAWWQR